MVLNARRAHNTLSSINIPVSQHLSRMFLPTQKQHGRDGKSRQQQKDDQHEDSTSVSTPSDPVDILVRAGYIRQLFKLKDRKGSDLILAPTHEEEITALVASEISSYRQLPLRIYQITNKFRDELRPRAGLLRGREFLMKDMYSFDYSKEQALATYNELKQAYARIFDRISVPYAIAEADSGNIGGSYSHEFHFLSPSKEPVCSSIRVEIPSAVVTGPDNPLSLSAEPGGEDTLLRCVECGYTANEERARGRAPSVTAGGQKLSCSIHIAHEIYPQRPEEVQHSNRDGAGSVVVALTPAGRAPNPTKVKKGMLEDLLPAKLEWHEVSSLDDLTRRLASIIARNPQWDNEPSPYDVALLADQSLGDALLAMSAQVREALLAKAGDRVRVRTHNGDWLTTIAGDGCPNCWAEHGIDRPLVSSRAIEVGHIFYLGTKYSVSLGARVNAPVRCNEAVGSVPTEIEMGCYGIGVSRVLQAVAGHYLDGGSGSNSESSQGPCWPLSVAPYMACIVPIYPPVRKSQQQQQAASDARSKINHGALEVYRTLRSIEVPGLSAGDDGETEAHHYPFARSEIAVDDRQYLSVGYRLNDCELIGFPFVVVVGKAYLSSGGKLVELKTCLPAPYSRHGTVRTRASVELPIGELACVVKQLVLDAMPPFTS
ncbi:hypothetical protein EV182_000431 [Spiromyces aspiralis]|uniref:Uncharacterized protein n=1 Tax=Spiromyces aspiralis TaxID=68401 RepID=A0ACC1HJL1_9FUNG|nr:hypothetical protein EV182_000431 [Spiromyces aspiralis]